VLARSLKTTAVSKIRRRTRMVRRADRKVRRRPVAARKAIATMMEEGLE